VDDGLKVPSFTGLPDSFRGAVDWLPEGVVFCPDLPSGEVLATLCWPKIHIRSKTRRSGRVAPLGYSG
jgi:hypothetical protein